MADGSKRYLQGRTDIVTNPVEYTISSFSIAGGIATVILTSSPSPAFTDTTVVYIARTGAIDGTFNIQSIISGTTFTIDTSSNLGYINSLTGDVIAAGPGAASATVVGINSAAVPASETYVGTNAAGQVVAAPTPPAVSTFADNEILVGSGTAWTFDNAPISALPVSTSVHLYVQEYNGGPFVRLPASAIVSITGTAMVTAASWTAGSLLADYRY
jgi:hypothetical protein